METGSASRRGGCAVRTASIDDQRLALSAYLDRQDCSEAVEFAPKDDDELDAALCAGGFDRVVFADLDALLTMVWKGHGQVDRWNAVGVRIELATPPTPPASPAPTTDAHDDCARFVGVMYDSLARWRKQRRRGQVIAAVVLSALALLALTLLFCLVPVAM